MLAEREKIAAAVPGDNVDHLASCATLRTGTDRAGTAGRRTAAQGRQVPRRPRRSTRSTSPPAAVVNKPLVLELAKGEYLDRRENILLVGTSGTGKTHLATALGIAACGQGKGPLLPRDRTDHPADGGQGRTPALAAAKQLAKLDLLILDELGYVPAEQGRGPNCSST